ncbi:DDE-type integrase/transposase/recombinase [Granulicella cerasi]|uniref:DDE-type integrase/transposase/recombinase n=1 Tax=Granulicella cerasi TaxID=741063 RepID=A0ABW1ZAB5_9BACT
MLSAEAERQAMERLSILQPLLDFCDNAAARERMRASLRFADGRRINTSDDLALYLVELHKDSKHRVSRPTLWRWKKAYTDPKQGGLSALARKVREDKGTSQWAKRWPEAAKMVAAAYMDAWQSKRTAYRALERQYAKYGMAANDVPSYEAVCDFLSSLPAAPVVLAREGERAYAARFATYLTRGYEDIAPNSVWVSDHCIHDVEVRNDCFDGVAENAPMRLRLTALMDLRSRMIVGATWTPEGSSRSISTVLAQAVRRFGPCDTFYCDNGKDFQKVGRFAAAANQSEHVSEDMLQIERAGALRMLGIKVQYCIKYHPQSKPIERMFRTMHLGLDAILPHYTTGNMYTRPDRANEDGALHRKLVRIDKGHLSPLIPASHFIRMAATWLFDDYNQRHKHEGRGMKGRTAAEIFFAGWSEQSRRHVEESTLDMLLWQRENRVVRNGAVLINNRRMIGATPYDVQQLHLIAKAGEERTNVIVCFDPNAPERAVVTDLDGHKVCDVRQEEHVTQSAAANAAIAASMQERRTLRNDTAASIRKLRHDVVRSGHTTAAQDLHERAMLPMAVGDHITQRAMQTQVVNTQVPSKHLHAEDIGDMLAATLAGANQ